MMKIKMGSGETMARVRECVGLGAEMRRIISLEWSRARERKVFPSSSQPSARERERESQEERKRKEGRVGVLSLALTLTKGPNDSAGWMAVLQFGLCCLERTDFPRVSPLSMNFGSKNMCLASVFCGGFAKFLI
jgi:hypothetical protein